MKKTKKLLKDEPMIQRLLVVVRTKFKMDQNPLSYSDTKKNANIIIKNAN